jgi:hypothetical protein
MIHRSFSALCSKAAPRARRVLFRHQVWVRPLRMVAPYLLAFSFTSLAHAQGTMDFSGATTLMQTFNVRPIAV